MNKANSLQFVLIIQIRQKIYVEEIKSGNTLRLDIRHKQKIELDNSVSILVGVT